MNIKNLLFVIVLIINNSVSYADDYTKSKEYLALRDTMHHAFNSGDSAKFFPAIAKLEDYLLKKNDLHNYYTQRCNEIVFNMNRQKIFDAYKQARQLSKELREKKIDKERYMALNMLGHINRYCGNKEEAKKNWAQALKLMEEEGYYSNMPPIYMNIVNISINDSHTESDSLLNIAKTIAQKYAPERVFDIETRQTASYYNRGDIERFLEGYKAYKEGEKAGNSSVYGRTMEIYYQSAIGHVDQAIEMAQSEGSEGSEAIPLIFERAGRWQEAYEALKKEYVQSDSISNVVLANSMQGISEEIQLYDTQRHAYRIKMGALIGIVVLLSLLIMTLAYIVHSRRKHLKELEKAYQHAMEADKLKAALIQNVSHEIRTPLNIINGFSQVIINPDIVQSTEERRSISKMMQTSTRQITGLLDGIIRLSLLDSTDKTNKDDTINLNETLRRLLKEQEEYVSEDTTLNFVSTLPDSYNIKTNKDTFCRIVDALLNNAVKYTEHGSITLKASKTDTMHLIIVEDTGCGIPASEAERIFERFVKLDDFKEGIGLGLSLSHKLAEQLNGSISLDISYTGGARFIVKLPILEL